MELWILLSLVVVGLAFGAAARHYASRRRAPAKDARGAKSIYPLW